MARDRSAARRMLVRRLIAERAVGSQEQLVRLLAARGHRVTQTTVSRDLAAVGVAKETLPGGRERYALADSAGAAPPGDRLRHMLREFALEIGHSRNMVVIKTPPGSAQAVASALDQEAPPAVLGTVAGDDTVLVVTRKDDGGAALARILERQLEG